MDAFERPVITHVVVAVVQAVPATDPPVSAVYALAV